MTEIKKIITALQNSAINRQLRLEPNIQVVGPDLLYQEAVLDLLEENDDIDYLLLSEDLPGTKIDIFLEKIPQIKTIVFTDKSTKNHKINGAYKQYMNGEVSLEEIKQIILQTNYTEELEQEIRNLKKQLQSQTKNRKPKRQNWPKFNFSFLSSKLASRAKKDKVKKIEITLKIVKND